jgi:DeoR/GlpR family transcriptional regulator of sugar metabolism
MSRNLSERYGVSEVSVRKYLSRIEAEGFAERFYGGAQLVETPMTDDGLGEVYSDPLWLSLARQARSHIADGDTVSSGPVDPAAFWPGSWPALKT